MKYMIYDPEIIEVVSNNIIKSIKYHIINNNERLEKYDSLLLWDNIIYESGKYIKKNNNAIKIKVKINISGIS